MGFDNRYEYIDYKGIKYPYIWLNIPEFGVYRVATLSLVNALLGDDGITYKSNEARAIDEMFFFYLDDDEIDRNDEELVEVILKAVV